MFFKRNKLNNIEKDAVFSSEELFHLVKGNDSAFEKVLTAGTDGNLSCQIFISEFYEMYLLKFKDEINADQRKTAKDRFVTYSHMSAGQGDKASKDRLFLFYINESESCQEITQGKIGCLELAIDWYEQSKGISEDDEILASLKESVWNLYQKADENVRQSIISSRKGETAKFITMSLNGDTANIINYENVLSHVDVVFSDLTDDRIIETRPTILSAYCLISSAGSAKHEGDIVYLEIHLRVLRMSLRYLVSAPQGAYNNTEIEILEFTTNSFNQLNNPSNN
jgi:hypothetical protein